MVTVAAGLGAVGWCFGNRGLVLTDGGWELLRILPSLIVQTVRAMEVSSKTEGGGHHEATEVTKLRR